MTRLLLIFIFCSFLFCCMAPIALVSELNTANNVDEKNQVADFEPLPRCYNFLVSFLFFLEDTCVVAEYMADLMLKRVLGMTADQVVGSVLRYMSLGMAAALEAGGWNSAVGNPFSAGAMNWPIDFEVGTGGENLHPDVMCNPNVMGRVVARGLSLKYGKPISFADVCFGGFKLCGKLYKARCSGDNVFMGFVKNAYGEWIPRCITSKAFSDLEATVNAQAFIGKTPYPQCPDPENMDMWGYDGYLQPICTPKIQRPKDTVQWVDSSGTIRHISCPPPYKPVNGVNPDGTIDCFNPNGGVSSMIRYVPFPSDAEKAKRIRPDDYVAYDIVNNVMLSIPREKPVSTSPTSPVSLPPKQIYTPHPPIYSDSGRCPDGFVPTGRNSDNQLICQRCPTGYIPIAVGANGKLICMEKSATTASTTPTGVAPCPGSLVEGVDPVTGKKICVDMYGQYGPALATYPIEFFLPEEPPPCPNYMADLGKDAKTGKRICQDYSGRLGRVGWLYTSDQFKISKGPTIRFPVGVPLDLRHRLEEEVKKDPTYASLPVIDFLGFDTGGRAQYRAVI